jgi:hypothetical protein
MNAAAASPIRAAGFLRREDAGRVRRTLARLFSLTPVRQVVLLPGVLAGLRLALPRLGIRTLLLGPREYFAPRHFPDLRVRVARRPLCEEIRRFRPDAVLVSPVSYDGREHDLRDVRAPLVIADATHAAAAGGFRLDRLGADLVVGDAAKWLLPPPFPSAFSYLWTPRPELFRRLRPAFDPFFLCVAGPQGRNQAQLLSLADLRRGADWIRANAPTRRGLELRHRKNLRLASALAGFGAARSAIVVVPRGVRVRPELALPLPGGRVRILCRSELFDIESET